MSSTQYGVGDDRKTCERIEGGGTRQWRRFRWIGGSGHGAGHLLGAHRELVAAHRPGRGAPEAAQRGLVRPLPWVRSATAATRTVREEGNT